jgi:gliding motility-associated-like protein
MTFTQKLTLLLLILPFTSNAQWLWGRGSRGMPFEAAPVTTDKFGNVYVAGMTLGDGFDTLGTFVLHGDPKFPGLTIAKYDAIGDCLWAKTTQNGYTQLLNMTTDNHGNLILLGTFDTSIKIDSVTLPDPGTELYFLAKIDQAGKIIWIKTDGNGQWYLRSIWGTDPPYLAGLATDSADNIYVATNSQLKISKIGSFVFANADTSGKTNDILVAKYDSSGNVIWAERFGGDKDDNVDALTVTTAGDIYIAGSFASDSIDFGSFVIRDTNLISIAYIARFNNSGVPKWASSSGGTGGECAIGLGSDKAGNMYVTGTLVDTEISYGTGVIRNLKNAFTSYLAKFDTLNNLVWYKIIGKTACAVWASTISVSPCGDAWFCGRYNASDTLILGRKTLPPTGLDPNVLIVGFNSSGIVEDCTLVPEGGDDTHAASFDAFSGSIFFCSDHVNKLFIGNDTLTTDSLPAELMYVAKYRPVDTFFNHVDTTICAAKNIVIAAPSGYTSYYWCDSSTKQSKTIENSGAYWVICKSSCTYATLVDTFNIINKDLFYSLGNDTMICNNDLVLRVPIDDASYHWQDGTTNDSFRVRRSGTYYVQLTKNGCVVSDTINVKVITLGAYSLDTFICREDLPTLTLKVNIPAGGSALWSTGSNSSYTTVSDSGVYWVTVSDSGCTINDTIKLASQYCNCWVVMPNAFSPNADGTNDVFAPIFQPDCKLTSYMLNIFDRWGQKMFTAHDISQGWDGTRNSTKADVGVYYWTMKYTSGILKQEHFEKGNLTLIR